MLRLIIHNHKCQLTGDLMVVEEIREAINFKIRVKNAYFAMMKSPGGWDGFRRFISPTGLFGTGLLPEVAAWLKQNELDYEVIDKRSLFKEMGTVTKLEGFEERDYQADAVKALVNNKLDLGGGVKIRYQRGILWEATNAGKNLIAACLFLSFSSKRKGLFLINNQTIFEQAVEELRELMGKDVVGFVSSKKVDWKRVNVCMVQTLANRIKTHKQIRKDVEGADIIIVDESDEVISRKDTQKIFAAAWNCPIRIGLTGTQGLSKDKIKNKESIEYLGPVLHRTRNQDLVDKGHSAKPIISVHEGNTKVLVDADYSEELEKGIIRNTKRNKKVWLRAKHHLKKGRKNVLILFKYHRHAKYLEASMPKWFKENGYKVAYIHGKNKNREEMLKKFKEGKINVLVCSMIVRRGKNLPSMRALINAAGGDSHSNLLQILGRALRKKLSGPNKVHIDDFMDMGKYLRRHSKHRITYYKNEGFPVKEVYKK